MSTLELDVPAVAVPPTQVLPAVSHHPIVLVLNTDSHCLKFSVYKQYSAHALFTGLIDGLASGELFLRVGRGMPMRLPTPMPDTDPLDIAMAALGKSIPTRLSLKAVVHRIAHGGESFVEPTMLDDDAMQDLRDLAPFAPLHQLHNLAGATAARRQWPTLPQIGCFDTAFHATMPELERRLALPESLDDLGIRRYGFHGLSYEHVVRSLQKHTQRIVGRALLAHLGPGSSLCAAAGGRSVGTSMGFSALDGLMTGTRSGSMDVGVVLHLLRQGWSLTQLEHLLYRESGLLGVSGLSSNLDALRASGAPQARLALDLFIHRSLREAGALITVMGGIDLLAFTGSIGVRDSELRAAWVQRLGFLGLRLNDAANACECSKTPFPLHHPDSAVEVWVVPCDEGSTAAQAAWERLRLDALEGIAPMAMAFASS